MIALARVVSFTFSFTFANAINVPTLATTALGGLLVGFIVGRMLRWNGMPLPARLVGTLVMLSLVMQEIATMIGQSLYAPVNVGAYLGGHTAYLVLALLAGCASVGGVLLARPDPHDAEIQSGWRQRG